MPRCYLACGVKFARDCGEEGCVVGAILNFVSRYSLGLLMVPDGYSWACLCASVIAYRESEPLVKMIVHCKYSTLAKHEEASKMFKDMKINSSSVIYLYLGPRN